jgi:TrmH family RNA methyltransferase
MAPAVEFVLLRSRRPANVAAACRAMKNMGFSRLLLVEPPAGLAEPEARALAYGAWDVLDGARVVASLREAVGGADLVVGTSARVSGPALTVRELADHARGLASESRLALVFGPEDQGLTRAELALCHMRVRIPTHPAQPSLNLAQAVLLLAYELRLAGDDVGATRARAPASAKAGEFEGAIDALRSGMLAIGYLNRENPDAVLGEIRGLLWRGGPTARELLLLRGLARQMGWAGQRAHEGAAGPSEDGPEG